MNFDQDSNLLKYGISPVKYFLVFRRSFQTPSSGSINFTLRVLHRT